MTAPSNQDPGRISELERFAIFQPVAGTNFRSKLGWAVRAGNPRLSVFTNDPNDTTKSPINAPMSPDVFFSLLDLLEECCDAEPNTRFRIENHTGFKNESGVFEKKHISDTWVGKDSNGLMWISVTAENRPKIKFIFTISEFHKIVKADGTPLTESEVSVRLCRGNVRALRTVYAGLINQLRHSVNKNATSGQTNGSAVTDNFKGPADAAIFDDLGF